MSQVWNDSSIHSRSEVLVLLAIADWSNDDNRGAWPSIDSLAKRARCSQRAVQDVLARLIRANKVHVDYFKGQNGTNIYRIVSGGVQLPHPADTRPKTGRKTGRLSAPEPLGTVRNRQEPSFLPLESGGKIVRESSTSPSPVGEDDEKAFRRFISLWEDLFQSTHGVHYVFCGGRDAKAVQELLSTKLSPKELAEIAANAWSRAKSDQFCKSCKNASTIHEFQRNLNGIQVELQRPKSNVGANGHLKEIPMDERDFDQWERISKLKKAEKSS